MNERNKKKEPFLNKAVRDELSAEFDSSPNQAQSEALRELSEHKRVRKVSPLGMRILVRIRRDNNVSEGGLYLPEGAKSSTSESVLADVLEVATATEDHTDEEANISGVPLGALVLIGKNSGVRVPWDDSLRLVETKEVLAIVHEVSLD